jgi:hypothetical protein
MTVTSSGRSVDQTSYRLVCEAPREIMRAGPGSLGRVGSIRYRASAVLYLLLLDHPIDWRGRCRFCPGVMIGLRPRPCQIHFRASDWLPHHSHEVVLSHLAREVGAGSVPACGAAGTSRWPGLTVRSRTDPGDLDARFRAAGDDHRRHAMVTVTPDADAAALDPRFPPQTPAGRWSSTDVPACAPGGQSVPRHPREEPSAGTRGARVASDRSRVHPLAPAEATTRGHCA